MADRSFAVRFRPERGNVPWMLLVLALATAAIFWPAFASKDFFSDDFVYVVANPALQRATFWQILTQRVNAFEFLPLRDLTYWLDWQLFGASPLAFRLHNWAWYLAACIAAWFAAYRLAELHAPDDSRNTLVALVAVAIFALHPLHVEPVAWVASRKDLVSGTFVLVATALWCRGIALRRVALTWLALPCLLLALAGKTTAIAFPVVAFALWWRWDRRRTLNVLAPLALLAVLAAGALLLDMSIRAKTGFASMADLSSWNPLALLLRIGGMALWKTLLPIDLRLVYDELFPAIVPGFGMHSALGLILCLGATVALHAYWRRKALWAFGAIWFCVFLLPYLQIVPTRTWSLFSDRFAFLPVFGAALAAAVALPRIPAATWRRAAIGGLAATLVGLSLLRSYDWRSSEALLVNDSKRASGAMAIQEAVVDTVYLPAGRFDEAFAAAARIARPVERRMLELRIENRRLQQQAGKDEWLAFAARVLQTEGNLVTGNIQVGSMFGLGFFAYGMPAQAEAIYRALIDSRGIASGERADARYNLALALSRQAKHDAALATYQEVVDDPMTPRHLRVSALNSIGAMNNGLGNPAGAEQAFSAALAIDPGYEFAAVNLANLYAAQGRDADLRRLLAGPAGRLAEVRKRFPGQ
jgi:tetratricopeptide (TPR) repeat protein